MLFSKVFYIFKPLIPRSWQLFFRRILIFLKKKKYDHIWPIDQQSKRLPENWSAWPAKKKFAFVLTHDVESKTGQNKCIKLMELERKYGFRSSFNFVPEGYPDNPEIRNTLIKNGFEVGVHGLNHDGKLYQSKSTFFSRAEKINRYIKDWNACGFRSPAMHHNLEWLQALDIEYDASVFDTDPFEPQSDGVRTIFPFWIGSAENGFVVLPYTLVQDFTLFILMREQNIDIWKNKIDWIAEIGGMVLVNTHPDYMNFKKKDFGPEEFDVNLYENLLNYMKEKYSDQYWHALPCEVARFFKNKYIV